MVEEKKEKVLAWAAYCTKCGECYGDEYGLHTCRKPNCGGKVDILSQPPRIAGEGKGIELHL